LLHTLRTQNGGRALGQLFRLPPYVQRWLWRALSNYSNLQQKKASLPPASDLMERLQDECIEVLINKEHAERL
jgi:hypothetical protein